MTEHPKLPDIVERLRTLLAKSGDERWAVEYDDRPNMESNNHIVLAEDTPKHSHKWPGIRIAFMAHDGPKKQDEFNAKAELIAAARNALPALLDELTRLRSPAPAEDIPSPTGTELALDEAKRHIATLTKFWMDSAGWHKASEDARAFIGGIPTPAPAEDGGRDGGKI